MKPINYLMNYFILAWNVYLSFISSFKPYLEIFLMICSLVLTIMLIIKAYKDIKLKSSILNEK